MNALKMIGNVGLGIHIIIHWKRTGGGWGDMIQNLLQWTAFRNGSHGIVWLMGGEKKTRAQSSMHEDGIL